MICQYILEREKSLDLAHSIVESNNRHNEEAGPPFFPEARISYPWRAAPSASPNAHNLAA